MERTLSILKPDVTRRNLTGAVNTMIEKAGFKIIAQKKIDMTNKIAGAFYAEHSTRPFYKDLCRVMSENSVIVQVLEKENAIQDYRTLMGATDPAKAEEGTIRKTFGLSLDDGNSVHGSDSETSAKREISFFFSELEIVG